MRLAPQSTPIHSYYDSLNKSERVYYMKSLVAYANNYSTECAGILWILYESGRI
jgi:hypothetical protein